MPPKVKILNDEAASSSLFPFDESRNDVNTSTGSHVHQCTSHFCPVCSPMTAASLRPSFVAVPKAPQMRCLPKRWWESEEVPWEDVAKAALALICPTLEENRVETKFFDDATISSDSSIICPSSSPISQCCSTAWSFISDEDDGDDDDEYPFDEPSSGSQKRLHS